MLFWKTNMQPIQSISNEAIEEYQRIYKSEFGEDITFEEAKEQGNKLLRLFDIIYKPINVSNLKK